MADPRPRQSLFAVWRCPWWLWASFIPLVVVAYFLTAPIAYYMLDGRGGLSLSVSVKEWVEVPLRSFFEPAEWCARESRVLSAVYYWEMDVLMRMFGSCCGA